MSIQSENKSPRKIFSYLALVVLVLGGVYFIYSYTRYRQGSATDVMSDPVVEIGQNSPSVIKETFDSGSYTNYKATFEAGGAVFVRLTVEEPSNSRTDYKIEDAVPSHVSGTINYRFERGSYVYTGQTTAVSGKITIEGKNDINLYKGKNYFKYSYKI
ncbi:MAG: hypothetical protein OEV37_01060 [Candidatus Berkelbacteria bacterium]|nr:hypothetical protein [Candidatus Berkelbacteria bacterium]